MRNNQKGFSPVYALLIALVVGIVGYIGWYVIASNEPDIQTTETNSDTPIQTSQGSQDSDDKLGWERITSGKNGFSVQIPDGWGEVLRPLDNNLLTIRNQTQPEYVDGQDVVVRDLKGFGTDAPGIFTVFISYNVADPRGVAEEFNVGSLLGKKYTYVALEDSGIGFIGQEYKGDKYYEYRFSLEGGKQLSVWYNVFAQVDARDQSSTVDQIVRSIKL